MSDLKLLNLKTGKNLKKQRIAKHELRSYLEENIEELLGVSIVFKDFSLMNTSDKVEILGYDENYQLVVIEYRMGKFTNTVNKGLVYLDYIKNNQSRIKTLLNEKLGYNVSGSINLQPRLLVIGDDFNKYDEYAIKQMPFMIDLIKYQVYENKYILLEKTYQSSNNDTGRGQYRFKNQDEYNLFKSISEFVLSLGDEVCEVNDNNFIVYRKIKNFLYLMFDEVITLKLKKNNFKTIKIKNMKDFEKAQIEIESCYDEN